MELSLKSIKPRVDTELFINLVKNNVRNNISNVVSAIILTFYFIP